MKTLCRWFAAGALVCSFFVSRAQTPQSGLLAAPDFNRWSMTSPLASCQVSSSGYTFAGLKVGRPVLIIDPNPAHNEIITPTQVSNVGGTCTFQATEVYNHSSYTIVSGTMGLQEAIDYQIQVQTPRAVVVITPAWTGTTQMITSATGTASVSISDQRTSQFVAYAWNGTQYVAVGGSGGGALFQPGAIQYGLTGTASRPATAADIGVLGTLPNSISGAAASAATANTASTAASANSLSTPINLGATSGPNSVTGLLPLTNLASFTTLINNVSCPPGPTGCTIPSTGSTLPTPPTHVLASSNATTGVAATAADTGAIAYAVDTGSINAYLAVLSPVVTSLTVGTSVQVKIAHTSTGASTLQLNGTAATAISKKSATGLVAISAGDLYTGQVYTFIYDGTVFETSAVSAGGAANPGGAQGQIQVNDSNAFAGVVLSYTEPSANSSNANHLSSIYPLKISGVYQGSSYLKVYPTGCTHTNPLTLTPQTFNYPLECMVDDMNIDSYEFQGPYVSSSSYTTGNVVSYTDGNNYTSLTSSNTGNTPSSSPTNWAVLTPGVYSACPSAYLGPGKYDFANSFTLNGKVYALNLGRYGLGSGGCDGQFRGAGRQQTQLNYVGSTILTAGLTNNDNKQRINFSDFRLNCLSRAQSCGLLNTNQTSFDNMTFTGGITNNLLLTSNAGDTYAKQIYTFGASGSFAGQYAGAMAIMGTGGAAGTIAQVVPASRLQTIACPGTGCGALACTYTNPQISYTGNETDPLVNLVTTGTAPSKCITGLAISHRGMGSLNGTATITDTTGATVNLVTNFNLKVSLTAGAGVYTNPQASFPSTCLTPPTVQFVPTAGTWPSTISAMNIMTQGVCLTNQDDTASVVTITDSGGSGTGATATFIPNLSQGQAPYNQPIVLLAMLGHSGTPSSPGTALAPSNMPCPIATMPAITPSFINQPVTGNTTAGSLTVTSIAPTFTASAFSSTTQMTASLIGTLKVGEPLFGTGILAGTIVISITGSGPYTITVANPSSTAPLTTTASATDVLAGLYSGEPFDSTYTTAGTLYPIRSATLTRTPTGPLFYGSTITALSYTGSAGSGSFSFTYTNSTASTPIGAYTTTTGATIYPGSNISGFTIANAGAGCSQVEVAIADQMNSLYGINNQAGDSGIENSYPAVSIIGINNPNGAPIYRPHPFNLLGGIVSSGGVITYMEGDSVNDYLIYCTNSAVQLVGPNDQWNGANLYPGSSFFSSGGSQCRNSLIAGLTIAGNDPQSFGGWIPYTEEASSSGVSGSGYPWTGPTQAYPTSRWIGPYNGFNSQSVVAPYTLAGAETNGGGNQSLDVNPAATIQDGNFTVQATGPTYVADTSNSSFQLNVGGAIWDLTNLTSVATPWQITEVPTSATLGQYPAALVFQPPAYSTTATGANNPFVILNPMNSVTGYLPPPSIALGAWSSATAYTTGQVVTYTDNLQYIALTANTNFIPPASISKWARYPALFAAPPIEQTWHAISATGTDTVNSFIIQPETPNCPSCNNGVRFTLGNFNSGSNNGGALNFWFANNTALEWGATTANIWSGGTAIGRAMGGNGLYVGNNADALDYSGAFQAQYLRLNNSRFQAYAQVTSNPGDFAITSTGGSNGTTATYNGVFNNLGNNGLVLAGLSVNIQGFDVAACNGTFSTSASTNAVLTLNNTATACVSETPPTYTVTSIVGPTATANNNLAQVTVNYTNTGSIPTYTRVPLVVSGITSTTVNNGTFPIIAQTINSTSSVTFTVLNANGVNDAAPTGSPVAKPTPYAYLIPQISMQGVPGTAQAEDYSAIVCTSGAVSLDFYTSINTCTLSATTTTFTFLTPEAPWQGEHKILKVTTPGSGGPYTVVLAGVNDGTNITFNTALGGTNTYEFYYIVNGWYFLGAYKSSQLTAPSGLPTIAAGAGAGTGPTISLGTGSTSASGLINLTIGTTPTAAGTLATITQATTLGLAPQGCSLFPRNAATAAQMLQLYTSAPTTTAWTVVDGATAIPAGTVLALNYLCQ